MISCSQIAIQEEPEDAAIALKVIGELQGTVRMNFSILLFPGIWIKSEKKLLENKRIQQMLTNSPVLSPCSSWVVF